MERHSTPEMPTQRAGRFVATCSLYTPGITATLLLLTLTACGGGGGSDSSDSGGQQIVAGTCDSKVTTAAGFPLADSSKSVQSTGVVVSGVIRAALGTAIDSDTNDPSSRLQSKSNNTPATAQSISNPVVLAGFASATGTGCADDVFGAAPDTEDRFNIDLVQGQKITLSVSDLLSARFILELYRADAPTVIVDSGNEQSLQTIIVPENGEYHIVVNALDGSSNYVLTVGDVVVGQSSVAQSQPADFVPGDIIVRFNDTLLPAAAVDALAFRAAAVGMSAKAGGAGRAMLFSVADEAQREQAFAVHGLSMPLADGLSDEQRLRRDTLAILDVLRKRADVYSADLNYIRTPSRVPDDEFYSLQWHYSLLNLPQAWDITTGDPQVVIAVVDTGVDVDHPDLAGMLTTTGYDFISDPSIALDGNGLDADANDPGDSSTSGRSSFHGTHVTGTVASASNNARGVAGTAWAARVMPLRTLGKGGGTSYDIMQAVRYAAGLSNDAGIILPESDRAQVINLSLGGPASSQVEQDTYAAVRATGAFVVAAAGNRSSDAPSYPAAYDDVVSVAAVEFDKRQAPYSNFGATIDIAAPGGNVAVDRNGDGFPDGVLSTWVDDSSGSDLPSYRFFQGTSMAAPHVAGVIALMKARHPGLTPDQFDTLLAAGDLTEDLLPAGRDNIFGHGLIDALKAVSAAARLGDGMALPPIVVAQPNRLNLGVTLDTASLMISNVGDDSASIVDVVSSVDWLQVTAAEVDANKLGRYALAVDRAGLQDSIYNVTVTFVTDSASSVEVPVTILVNSNGSAPTRDTGLHFVVLVDARTGNTVQTVSAPVIDGVYNYAFQNVAPGSYFVVAGTDSDNDGILCDAGEACGGYPIVSLLQTVGVGNANVTGLAFDSSFNPRVSASGSGAQWLPLSGFSRYPGPAPIN